jgi:quercetin dioxygenase-like cupin family protein
MTQEPVTNLPLTRAIVVASGVSRWGAPTTTSAEHVWTKVSQEDTAGQWSMFESLVPAGFGVPLHRHFDQEEWFWILEGHFIFDVAPRQIPHRWKKTSEADGRMLILVQPSSGMEVFFDRFARLSPDQLQDLAFVNGLFAECNMEVMGPPLDDSVR